jgi:cell division septum initiation protein DivIVA
MAKLKWEDLLPASSRGGASQSDLLGQLAASTGGGGGGGASGAGNSIAGVLQGNNSDVTEQLASLTTQISSLTSAQQEQVSALQDNTQAVTQNTSSKAGSGTSAASTVASAASSVLGGGLSSLSPLLGGLLSLFGGGGQTLAAPAPFMLPAPVQSEAGVTSSAPGQVLPVSYGETGQPRAQSTNAPAQVTIQVNAIDSQSFLDHSDDIAMAVKQAILSSSSLNDVIASL